MYCVEKILTFLVLFLLHRCCASTDAITQDRPIKDGDILVSDRGSFALGFFSPGNPSNRYVDIWYNKVSKQTVVWVANRDNPITGFTGVLSIDSIGNLVLLDQNRDILVSLANVSAMTDGNATSAQLLDTGNLVLLQGNIQSVVAWQSFDYPTNTMLPYMKIGVNRRKSLNWFLTSWKSREDPGTGEYCMKFDLNGSPQLFFYKGSVRVWRTGPWIGHGWSGVPEMTNVYVLNSSFVDNDEEVYLTNGMTNPSIFSRMMINESGLVERFAWLEEDHRWLRFWSAPMDKYDNYRQCGVYSDCDLYNLSPFECKCLPGFEPKSASDWYLRDGSKGCVGKRGGDVCGNGEGFVKVANVKVPDTSTALVDKSMGKKACEDLCLRNCSCSGYTGADVNGTGIGCITWYGDLVDTRQFVDGGQDLYIRVDLTVKAQKL